MDSLLRPVETTVDGAPACHWPMQEYPPPPVRAGILMQWCWEEAYDAGFTQAVAVDLPETTTREIRLLGPDSPGEYIYSFDRRLVDVRWLTDLTRDIVWFTRRMARIREV